MTAPTLRPLRVGEVLDAGIKIYRGNARTLMGLTAIVVVPFQVLSAIVLLSTLSSASDVPRGLLTAGTRATDPAASLAASVILGVTGFLAGLFTTAACVRAVSDVYLDQPTDLRKSLRFALRRLGSLLWLHILAGVLLLLAAIALFIPAIWLYAAWFVATPVLLIEGRRGYGALRRSQDLVKHRWWPTAAVILVANVMVSVIAGVIQGALVAISLSDRGSLVLAIIVVSLAAAVSAVLTRPFLAAVTTVMYYDLRVRREGYDVELLAEQLGLPPTAISAGAWTVPGPESVGKPGGPPFWPPPPGWSPPALDP